MGTVRCEWTGAVARLVLDNPPDNALTAAMVGELEAHVRAIEADAGMRAVVIQGAGPDDYTAGADFGALAGQAGRDAERDAPDDRRPDDRRPDDHQAAARAWLEAIHAGLDAIAASAKVYLCAMKGRAHGTGLEIAAACDLRIAALDARFAMPEVGFGVIPGGGGTQRLARLIGVGHTLALVLSAEAIDVETARVWGLVDHVVPAGEAEATALALAERIAGYAPLALAEAKRAIHEGADVDLAWGLAREREGFLRRATSADFAVGRQAATAGARGEPVLEHHS